MVNESVKVLVAEMLVAYSLSWELVPRASVSKDCARVTNACRELIIVAAEVMATLFVLLSALAVALAIADDLLLTASILALA